MMLRRAGVWWTRPILFGAWRDGFFAKPWRIGGIFVQPERPHDRIGDVRHASGAKWLVLKQTGEIEQRRVRYIHQGPNGMGENLLELRPPEIGPNGPKNAATTPSATNGR